MVRHSSGEIDAAFAAGLLTKAQAIVIAFYRDYAVDKITSHGCIMAIGMDAESADNIIEELSLKDQAYVACVNSPESVKVSGAFQSVDKLMKRLEAKGTFVRNLSTGVRAYHLFLMKEIGDKYKGLISKALMGLPTPYDVSNESYESEHGKSVRFFSSVGNGCDALSSFTKRADRLLRPNYWRENLENPVQFNTAIKKLLATGSYHLIEIGPHSALQGPIKQILAFLGVSENVLPYSPTLVRGKDANISMKFLAGELIGHAVDFIAVNETQPPASDKSGKAPDGPTVGLKYLNWSKLRLYRRLVVG